MLRALHIAISVVLLGVGISASVAASSRPLGLWSAALHLSPDQDATEAVARGDLVARFLSALAVGIQVDPETEAWLKDLRDCIVELDLHRTWGRLPDVRGEERSVHIVGRNEGTHGYTLTLSDRAAPSRRALGDVDGQASLRPQPWQGASAFTAGGHLALTTHPIGHAELRNMAGAVLLTLEDATRGTTDPATNEALEARFRADFPATMSILDRVLTFEQWGRRLADDVVQVDIAAHIDPDRLAAAGYPALARFVRRMANVADISVTVQSRHGEVGTIWARSPGRYGIRFATRNGALIPVSKGVPATAGALPAQSTTSAALAFRPKGIIRLKGVRLTVHSWTVPLRYTVHGDSARLSLSLHTLPDVDFRSDGGVGGWLVATAGNAVGLEAQALRFFESVADGSEGAGSTMNLTMSPQEGHWTLDGDWNIRMLDNLIVRFAAQVMGDRVVPDDDVLDELLSLETDVVGALATDWQQIRPLVAASTPQPPPSGAGVSGSR